MPQFLRVWDLWVRIGHWSLVSAITAAWLTRDGYGRVHDYIGYSALIIVLLRIVWGFTGSPHARFSDFLRGPRVVFAYGRDLLANREANYTGHNPLGGWMIAALLFTIAATGFTGWLYTTDYFWGVEWMEDLHAFLGTLILPLAALHVGGVIFTSWRQKQNLVAAMVHGWKRQRD